MPKLPLPEKPNLKLVVDTNVVVSGLLKPNGKERLVLDMVLNKLATLAITPAILMEYQEVLLRPKFGFNKSDVFDLCKRLKAVSRVVKPSKRVAIASDPKDNMFLECAESASANFLVTGNLKHFPAVYKKTKVANASDFLEWYTLEHMKNKFN